MFTKINYKPAIALATLLALALLGVLPALAAAPLNDDILTATPIFGVPFSEGIDTSEATSALDDPYPGCNFYMVHEKTVWYQFSPTDTQLVVANSNGSNYLTVVAVYTGSPGSLLEIACETGFNPVGFQANVGEVYYIMVAAIPGGTGEWLEFSLTGASPPVADFSYWNAPEYGPHSVYFTNSSYDPDCYWCNLTAYWEFGDGSTSSELYPIHQYPSDGGYLVTLTVTTEDGRTGQLQQQVEVVTPPPDAHFYYYPGDPTTYDMVRFNYWFCSWCSVLWEFGDGSTSNEMNPIHQYAADGDYTVLLTVTDLVGQSASTTQLIRVKTIDVAVARFMVPQSAKAGQTRSVAVDISNTTYPVEVKVQLYKSNGQNWEWVGFLQQTVPVRPANRGTSFEFSYTFTQADALLGSINFRAVALLINDRDAFPINNETISLPTKVMP